MSTVVRFDEQLHAMIRANLAAHPRREQPLDGRRHAAVALVVLDSDPERDGRDPLAGRDIDLSGIHDDLRALSGRSADGLMAGVAGGAAFLLSLRPAKMRRHAFQWALPGGRLEPGETPLDAALRELHEELGLRLGPENLVGWLDDYVTRSGFVMTPVVLWCAGDPVLTPDPDEVLAAYRIGLHALLECRPRFPRVPDSDRPMLQLPLGRDLIHAPTGAILYQFRQVALRGRTGARVDGFEEPAFARR
jgi:8-oxo-dGTP pyrophosphatase MutT (NUDIX family)